MVERTMGISPVGSPTSDKDGDEETAEPEDNLNDGIGFCERNDGGKSAKYTNEGLSGPKEEADSSDCIAEQRELLPGSLHQKVPELEVDGSRRLGPERSLSGPSAPDEERNESSVGLDLVDLEIVLESEEGPAFDQLDALPPHLRYSNFDLLCTFVSMLTYLFDLAMDCAVAYYFYHLAVSHGIYHYWYFGLTVTFIVVPSLTMTGFSLRWYLMDADNDLLPKVSAWKWVLRLAVLLLQFSPLLRYADSIYYGLLSRKAGEEEKLSKNDPVERRRAREKRIKNYTLMVYEDADATLLRLFESFMESAPQLVLQIYILIKDPHATRINDTEFVRQDREANIILRYAILSVSVISSLVSLAWSLVVYHRSLRYTYEDKKNMNLIGSIFQFMWHFSSITARVMALSLFASVYPEWIGVVCFLHWMVMSGWILYQRTRACSTKCEELLFCWALGVVYIFSFFNAKEEKTRRKYLAYYSFCFCENTVLVVTWCLNLNSNRASPPPSAAENEMSHAEISPSGTWRWYYYPGGLVGHYLAFFLGIVFMVTYYTFFHPADIDISRWKRPLKLKRNSTVARAIRRLSRHNNDSISPSGEAPSRNQQSLPVSFEMQKPSMLAEAALGGIGDRQSPRSSASSPTLSGGGAYKRQQHLNRCASLPAQHPPVPVHNKVIHTRRLKSMGRDWHKD